MFSASTRNDSLRWREGHVKELAGQLPSIVGRSTQDAAEVVEDRDAALASSRDHAGKDFLSAGAGGVSIAPEDLSIDDRRTNGLVGPASGGLNPGVFQEGKNLPLVGLKMVGEDPIQRLLGPALEKPEES